MIPQVLLLCGGRSSRMWPLSDKIFFEYIGKTVLEHQIDMLLASGFTEKIHIMGNADNLETIKNIIQKEYTTTKSIFSFSCQKIFKQGMLNGILSAEESLDLLKPLLIVSSNDIVENFFFENLLAQYKKSDADIFICGKKVESYFPGGYLVLDSEKNVEKIVEKPEEKNVPSDMINLVFHLFRYPQKLFEFLQNQQKASSQDDGYEVCLQNLFDSGQKAEVISYDGFWQALKYPWHHLSLMDFFLQKLVGKNIHKSVHIPKTAVISGNVIIEEGVKIFDFAVISGPVYVGKNCVLGNHSLVRNSSIGDNCVVGHTTEIARSYLCKDVWTHQNYIGDSVVDQNVSFGAGCRTGNFRLDEREISVDIKGQKVNSGLKKLGLLCGRNVRCGINTSLMPGIKIGENSLIGAGLSVDRDIENNTFLCIKNGEIIKKQNTYIPPAR